MPEVPGGIPTVVLTGRYIRPDGTPLSGTLTFEAPSFLTMAGADIISAGSAVAELDSTGAFSIALIATDDPGTQPSDWTYTVVERFRHATGRTFHIALPEATPVVDLADIAPTDPSGGEYVVVTGPAGKDGSQIYSGTGAPLTSLGVNGDYYVDVTPGAVKLYGPKAAGDWTSNVALNGVSSVNSKTGVVSLTAADVGADPAGTAAGLTAVGVTDWINVRKAPYGAVGDGTTDDAAAIQAALNACPAGGIVYLPAKVFRTSVPIKVPPFVTLRGGHGGGEAQSTSSPTPACIKPLPGFTGNAVIQVLDQQLGGYSTLASEVKIENITVDGSAVPIGTAVDGIRATGQIQHLQLRDVQLRQMTGQGFNTTYNLAAPPGPQAPFCLHFERVSVLWCKSFGIALNNSTDSYFSDVYVLGCSGTGWYVAGCAGSTWIGCRAEWSGGDGFQLVTNSGVQTFIACSTDRNNNNGFSVQSSTSTGTIVLSGCRMTRDGRSSTTAGYAGLNVNGTTRKVIADGLVITTGRDDDGTSGNLSPQYGVSATNSAYVVVASGDVNGVSSAWRDGGGNTTLLRGPAVTGSSITSWQWPGTAASVAAAAASVVLQSSVSGDTQQRLTVGADGKLSWGSGSATPDTILSRVGAAILNLAGTLRATLAAVTTAAFSTQITGDTVDRWHVNGDGKQEWSSGSAAVDANLYRSGPGALKTDSFFAMSSGQASGGFTVFSGAAKALVAGTAGGGLAIKEGTNARMGSSTLVGGTVTVANTSATSTTRIFLSRKTSGGTVGTLTYTVSAGTSFTITSSSASDTSVVEWLMVEQA